MEDNLKEELQALNQLVSFQLAINILPFDKKYCEFIHYGLKQVVNTSLNRVCLFFSNEPVGDTISESCKDCIFFKISDSQHRCDCLLFNEKDIAVIPIQTIRKSFGYIAINNSLKIKSNIISSIKNFANFIAINIENNQQKDLLEAQNIELSEHKNHLEKLVKLHAKTNTQIINSVQEGIIVYDRNLRYMVWNPFMEKLSGIPASRVLGKYPTDVFPFLEEAGVIKDIKRALNGELTEAIDVPFNLPDTGKSGWTTNQYTPLRDANDEIIGVIGTVHDISAYKQQEQAIKNSESSLRDAQEIAKMGSWEWDLVTQKTNWSDSYFTILGFKPNEVEPTFELFRNRIHPDDVHSLDENFAAIKKDIKPSSVALRLIKPDGTFKWIQNYISPVNEDDKLVKLKGVIIDISDLKQTELELIKAKEKAEESDRLKSAFLTNMSHEIRTPLNSILGFAELLKEPNLKSDDQQDYIQTMQISGTRLLNTINSIIDISKIESGLMKVDIKETNLNEKIEFTYKYFKPEVEKKGLKFIFKSGLPSKESIIKTDNEKVYGILANLIKNAIKFTYDGSIEFGYEKKWEYLEFYVKDTGIGIPKNQQEIVFERFRQGSENHNRGYEGSGLGLSIAKSYIEMLGGEIWVESDEMEGSTFYFTIPYNAVMEEKTAIENAVSEKDKEVEIKNLKILIVEDDEISYSFLTRIVQKISYEVLHAITGIQAIEACRNNPDIDLVLMDIRMPKMDGNEATRQIRQFNKDVVIIAQTAYGFSSDREMTIEAGCNDYISKPINMTLLYELIKKHCNRKKINNYC